jgi:parallel beta-helix repeat protein
MKNKNAWILPLMILVFAGSADCAIYYVSPTGSDSRTCAEAQDIGTPRLTANAACECLSAGDTLYLREGTYEESIRGSTSFPIPSGTSWSDATTIASYPGETATLRPPQGGYGVFNFGRSSSHHIVIDGLVLDGINTLGSVIGGEGGIEPSMCFHHVSIRNSEIMNGGSRWTETDPAPTMYGAGISSCGGDIEILNNSIHDIGVTDFDHGIYIGVDNVIVDGNEIYNNAGWGIHKYPAGNNWIIRNNRVHDNARIGERGQGILVSPGTNNLVYNNIVWENRDGIVVKSTGTRVFSNTVANNINCGICNEAANSVIVNNIVYGNGGLIDDAGSGTTVDNNLLGTDPLFVNAGENDFHLQEGSPAIDAGSDLSSEGVATDFDGVSRPQGEGYDIGAYEYNETQTGPATPSLHERNLQIKVESTEMNEIVLKLDLPVPGNLHLQVYDVYGHRVFNSPAEEMAAGNNRIFLPNHALKNGVYTAMLQWRGKNISKRIAIVQ